MAKYVLWYNEDPTTFQHTQHQWRVAQDLGSALYSMGSVEQYAPETKGLGKGKNNARKAAEAFAKSRGANVYSVTDAKDNVVNVQF